MPRAHNTRRWQWAHINDGSLYTSCDRRAHPISVQMRGIINLAVDLLSQSAADGTLRLLLGEDNKRPIKMQIDSQRMHLCNCDAAVGSLAGNYHRNVLKRAACASSPECIIITGVR